MNPRPTPDILSDFYLKSENYKYFNDYIFPASLETRRNKIFIPRVERVIELCKYSNIETDKLLEIGAGFGIFCEEMVKKNVFNEIVGIEASDSLAETCTKKGFRIYNGLLEQLEINETFDCIVAFEVLEHIFNPQKFLEISSKLLKANGILMLTFPNYNGFDIGILGTISDSIDHEHQNYFNEKSVSILLEKTGFVLSSVSTPGELDLDLVRKKILEKSFVPNSFINDICINRDDKLREKFQIFLQENNMSSNMMIIAHKN